MTDTYLPPIFGVLIYSRIQGFAHAEAWWKALSNSFRRSATKSRFAEPRQW